MRTAYLDGGKIATKEELHSALAEQLAFPAWYGRNLDALYDLLSVEGEGLCIVLRDRPALEAALGGYFRVFLGLLEDVAAEGRAVSVREGEPAENPACAGGQDLV